MNNQDLFHKVLAQTTPKALGIEIIKAEGSYLFGPNGEKYLDFISGLAVANTGHKHPKVLDAITRQLDKHAHVMPYGEYIQEAQVGLATKLISLLPENFEKVYFTNSGTEANEAALKLAKRYTGRYGIISFQHAYHGSTHGSLSIGGNESRKNAFRPLLPGIKLIEFNNPDDLDKISDDTAAVIIEPVQGDAGVRIPDNDYLNALRKRCDQTGSLLIFDEVQTGFGRTGTMFCFEQFGVVPDVITLAKALGGGLPLGAFISSSQIMDTLMLEPILGHITTFGGNPVSCAAALAQIQVIEEENLLSHVEEKGAMIEKLLYHNRVIEFRRIGMMMALELENEEHVQKVVHNCIESGVICFWFLSHPQSFRIAPPLTISEEEIEEGCSIILQALDKF